MRRRRMGPPTRWERAAAADRLKMFGLKRPARPNAYSVPVAEIMAVSPTDVAIVFWKRECDVHHKVILDGAEFSSLFVTTCLSQSKYILFFTYETSILR